MKKLVLTLALALIPAGAAMAEDALVPADGKEAPAVVVQAEKSCAQALPESPLFTAKIEQRLSPCSSQCIAEFNACRAACTDRICLGICGDELDYCLSMC